MNLIEAISGRLAELSGAPAPDHFVTAFDPRPALPAARRIKSACVDAKAENALGVAEVLFPAECFSAGGDARTKLDAGLTKIGRLRAGARKSLSGWKHTYFERLIGRYAKPGGVEEIGQNRLADIVEKANNWNEDFGAAFYASTTHANDGLRPRGSPCLQYVQFGLLRGNEMRLFALYRSHDFVNKALGNFIGLRRVGQFVATETGRSLIEVVVISLHPFVDRRPQARDLRDGLAQL